MRVGIAEEADMLKVGEAGVAVNGPGFSALSGNTVVAALFVSNVPLLLYEGVEEAYIVFDFCCCCGTLLVLFCVKSVGEILGRPFAWL